jgi:hypothetical protein
VIKVAYLLAPFKAKMAIPGTRRVYSFQPWALVEDEDWPLLQGKKFYAGCGCRGQERREIRVFGSEQEVRDGVLGFNR